MFDLGYFSLDRFQNLTRAGAFWISRLQHGTSVFDAQGQPLALLRYLRRQTGRTDRRVGPAGREPSPALPIDRSAGAPRGSRPEATESLREGPEAWPRAIREYLKWQDWTFFVTNCEPELLTWEAVVLLYRARWQIELMFKLWK